MLAFLNLKLGQWAQTLIGIHQSASLLKVWYYQQFSFTIFPVLQYCTRKAKQQGKDKSRAESFLILKQVGIPSDNMGLQWIYNQDIEFY